MGLSAAGLLLPWVSGGQIRKVLSRGDWQKYIDDMNISTKRPLLAKAISEGNPHAKAVEQAYEKISKGDFVIPEKTGLIDVDSETIIIPKRRYMKSSVMM